MLRAHLHTKLLCVWIALACGCDEGKPTLTASSTPAEPAVDMSPPDQNQPLSPPKPEVAWAGHEDVLYGPAQTLFEEEGFLFEEQPWKTATQRGVAYRVRVGLPGHAKVLPSDRVVPLEQLAPKHGGAWALINGGFYEAAEVPGGYRPMGVVRSNGEQHRKFTHRGGSGVFAVEDGEPRIVHRPKWKKGASNDAAEALQSIDRIIAGSKLLVTPKKQSRTTARSAVAIGEDHIWLIIVAADAGVREFDGGVRLFRTGYAGMTLFEFARYIEQTTGAADVLNLDGSVSTQMIVKAGDELFKIIGERGTINAIYLAP